MDNILESLRFDLTKDEVENGPAIFVLLEEPELFSNLLLESILKVRDIEIEKYEKENFIRYFKEVEEDGIRKITTNNKISLSINLKKSIYGSFHTSFEIKRSALIVEIGASSFTFDTRRMTCSILFETINKKIEKFIKEASNAHTEEDYRNIENLFMNDQDQTHDFKLLHLETENVKIKFKTDTFSNNKSYISFILSSEYDEISKYIKKDYYGSSTLNIDNLSFIILEMREIIKKLEVECNNLNYLLMYRKLDYPNSINIKKSKLSKEETVENNRESIDEYYDRWFSDKKFEKALENERNIIAQILGKE